MTIYSELSLLINEYIELSNQMDYDLRIGKDFIEVQDASFGSGSGATNSLFVGTAESCLNYLSEYNKGACGPYSGGMFTSPDYQPLGNYYKFSDEFATTIKYDDRETIFDVAKDYALSRNQSVFGIGEGETTTTERIDLGTTKDKGIKGLFGETTTKYETKNIHTYSSHFGLGNSGTTYYTSKGKDTGCTSTTGCTDSVYLYSADPNCFLYQGKNGTFTPGGDGVAFVPTAIYYGERLNRISIQIEKLIDQSDEKISKEYKKLMSELNNSTSYETFFQKVAFQKKQLEIFGKRHNLINEKYNISYDKLQSENIVFRVWVLVFLFILSIIFYLFKDPIKSFSYVCVFFIFVILISILKLLKPVIFMILIMVIFMLIVLGLFYKKKYSISIGMLVVGSFIFALIYRL